LWFDKMQRNGERDLRSTALAEGLGWVPVRLWECEIRDGANAAAERVLAAVQKGTVKPPVMV